MERDITFLDTGVLSRINDAIAGFLDFNSREPVNHTIPKDFDLSQVSFTFGQYKGRLINQIWKLDKHYIKKLSRQQWLSNYPLEDVAVHTLLNNQRLFKS